MITKEQAEHLDYRRILHQGTCSRTVGPKGGVTTHSIQWRVNGIIKIWVTRPDEFTLPIKHGLKQCSYLTERNAHMFHIEENCPLRRKDHHEEKV